MVVVDCKGRQWTFGYDPPRIEETLDGTTGYFDINGHWQHDGKKASNAVNIELARRTGSLCGDPFIAGSSCNYPKGAIIDYFCLACGSSFAGHGDESDCWRVLKTTEELRQYDEAMDIAEKIRYDSSGN